MVSEEYLTPPEPKQPKKTTNKNKITTLRHNVTNLDELVKLRANSKSAKCAIKHAALISKEKGSLKSDFASGRGTLNIYFSKGQKVMLKSALLPFFLVARLFKLTLI